MRILHLTLYCEWFDQIAKGEKTEEYRDDKPYWRERLFNRDGSPIIYDEIHFTNGYGKNRPFMRAKMKDVVVADGRIVIRLGQILEVNDNVAMIEPVK